MHCHREPVQLCQALGGGAVGCAGDEEGALPVDVTDSCHSRV